MRDLGPENGEPDGIAAASPPLQTGRPDDVLHDVAQCGLDLAEAVFLIGAVPLLGWLASTAFLEAAGASGSLTFVVSGLLVLGLAFVGLLLRLRRVEAARSDPQGETTRSRAEWHITHACQHAGQDVAETARRPSGLAVKSVAVARRVGLKRAGRLAGVGLLLIAGALALVSGWRLAAGGWSQGLIAIWTGLVMFAVLRGLRTWIGRRVREQTAQ